MKRKNVAIKTSLITTGIATMLMSPVTLAQTWQEIDDSGELRIGVTADYSPLSYFDTQGQLSGFDVEMTQDLAKSLGLKARFVITTWPTLSQDLAADKFDIAAGGITKTLQRGQEFLLTTPVTTNGKVALTQCSQVEKLSSLIEIDKPDVKVIVNPGGTNQKYVDEHIKQAQIIRTKDNVANIQGVRDESADIMFTDLIEGNYYQEHEKGTFCVSTPILDGTQSYNIYMMKKEAPELLEKTNVWLQSGIKETLAEKWQIPE